MPYSVTVYSAPAELDSIRPHWLALTERYPHHFYQSWHWVGTWLQLLPPTADVQCFICTRDNAPVLGFFVGRKNRQKYGLLSVTAAHLNEAGIGAIDAITAEQNDFVGAAEELDYFLRRTPLLQFMAVSEFNFRFATERLRRTLSQYATDQYLTATHIPSAYVDLSRIRRSGQSYIETLSKNKRQQIRRSIRKYEANGKLELQAAADGDEAKRMLEHMAALHQETWTGRGRHGSFANSCYTAFHRALIDACFSSGCIFIAKVSSPTAVVGYIYGFIHNKHFLFYQSGLNYANDNKLKPGFVAHYLLINHFAERQLDRYDFLAGDADYKTSLATDTELSYHLVLRKKNLMFRALHAKNRLAASFNH